MLADEPTGNVDPELAQRLLRLFIELHKSGTSIVIATHDVALMDQFDAPRLVLHEGRLRQYRYVPDDDDADDRDHDETTIETPWPSAKPD